MSGMRVGIVLVAVALAATLSSSPSEAQTVISNEADPEMEQHTYIGFPQLTIGQTFRAPNPADVFLQTFRFSLGSDPAPLPYTARLMEWDAGVGTAGAVLYEEAFPGTGGGFTYMEYTINRLLSFGADYIFAVSIAGSANAFTHASLPVSTYDDGQAAFIQSTNLAELQGDVWQSNPFMDHGFTAVFGPAQVVPEPATVLLLASGLFGVAGAGAVRRRRRV